LLDVSSVSLAIKYSSSVHGQMHIFTGALIDNLGDKRAWQYAITVLSIYCMLSLLSVENCTNHYVNFEWILCQN